MLVELVGGEGVCFSHVDRSLPFDLSSQPQVQLSTSACSLCLNQGTEHVITSDQAVCFNVDRYVSI
jgi:hypothetical protein